MILFQGKRDKRAWSFVQRLRWKRQYSKSKLFKYWLALHYYFILQQPHDLQGRHLSSCHDLINSISSLAVIGMNKEDSVSTNDENKYRRSPPHTTDEESPLYRSHSSFSNTDSFVSLISRKPSFARSSNTLLERYSH